MLNLTKNNAKKKQKKQKLIKCVDCAREKKENKQQYKQNILTKSWSEINNLRHLSLMKIIVL